MEPIIVVECKEPDGVIERKVYPFVLTQENGLKFWQQAKKFPRFYERVNTESAQEFLDAFFKYDPFRQEATSEALLWVIDDFVGVFSLTNIYHPEDAIAHFTFFDKRTKGRGPLIQGMIKWVFDNYGFNRLSVEIPAYASKILFKFLDEEVGLVLEGRKRKALKYRDKPADIILYGITPEDIEIWERRKQKQLGAELLHQ